MKVWIVQQEPDGDRQDIIGAFSTEEAARALEARTQSEVIEITLDEEFPELFAYIAFGPGSCRPDLPCKEWPSNDLPETTVHKRRQPRYDNDVFIGWTDEVIDVQAFGRTPEEAESKAKERLADLVEHGCCSTI